MKKAIIFLFCIFSLSAFAQDGSVEPSQPPLRDKTDSLNYFLGLSFAHSLATTPWQSDMELITMGIRHVMTGETPYDRETCSLILQDLIESFTALQAGQPDPQSEANLDQGRAFLEENGMREEVTTTSSGLQYEVVVEGEGPKPAATSSVRVHYEGTLIDGTVFDSSYERGEPISFPLDRVIPGWTEGVQLMPVGSTYKFYIPPGLAYGDRAAGTIPANSVLIFKVELLGIE